MADTRGGSHWNPLLLLLHVAGLLYAVSGLEVLSNGCISTCTDNKVGV